MREPPGRTRLSRWRACAALAIALVLWSEPGGAAARQPVANAAYVQLAALVTSAESSASTYERNHFGSGWIGQGGCRDTRALVLVRSSSAAVTYGVGGCSVSSGSWWSPYDGTRHSRASALDVDHLVPLEEAWTSGAASDRKSVV